MQKWAERSKKIADLLVGALCVPPYCGGIHGSFAGSYSYADLVAVLLGFFVPATIFIALDYYLFNSLVQDLTQKHKLLLWNVLKLCVLFLLVTYVLVSAPYTVQLQGALYLLPIVLAAIALGRAGGLLFALAASFLVLILYWGETGGSMAVVLENVFWLPGVFLLSAWFLGDVMEIENNTSLRLAVLANKDEITGLNSHRFFLERLKAMVETAIKENETLFVFGH